MKDGPGRLVLGGALAQTDGTEVKAGTLVLENDATQVARVGVWDFACGLGVEAGGSGRDLTTQADVARVWDDERGGYIAGEYLLSKGYTEFIVISGPHTISSFEDRYRGFIRCLTDHGIDKTQAQLFQIAPTWEEAYALTKHLGTVCHGKAVFAFSDFMAMGSVKALREIGLHVPRDVAIMGYDNVEDSNIVNPSLTTVDIRATELGQISARRLLECIHDPKKRSEPIRELLEPQLIVRESV